MENGEVQRPAYKRRNNVVLLVGWVFVSPRVIAPVNNSLTNMLITVDQERWPMIAAPGIIRWMMEETDIFPGYASCQQVGGSQGFHRVVRHIHADLLVRKRVVKGKSG